MAYRYRPFDQPLSDIAPEELNTLRMVSEGWHVEYKREPLLTRNFAKSLAAFANHYGGWLFIGIEEAQDGSNTAGVFIGVANDKVPSCLENLRNASKDSLVPHVFYRHRVFEGPIDIIGLALGYSIIVVEIPQGPDPPYFHSDGRVYRRIADASDPKPETDRNVLDRLWERGKLSRDKLTEAVTHVPKLSSDEKDLCFMNLSIYSDPLGAFGHFYKKKFLDFKMAMKNPNYVPLDNIYSKSDGFVARQVGTNNPGLRTLTWEFNFRCTSFVTIPINHTTSEFEIHFRDYSNYSHFGDILRKANISHLRIIDLNILLDAVAAIIAKHRILVASSRIVGPFYCKAHILNAWRTVPFIDTEEYVNHVEEMGLPIVQDENIIVPPGTRLESFINLPERDASQLTDTEIYGDAGQVAIFVLAALGIPPDLFISDMADILRAGIRAKLISRRRSEPT